MRIPDLAVTCTSYTQEETLLDNPVLVVEILSPGNQAERWANFRAYTTIPSVREILIVRSAVIGAELLRRNADGTWPAEAAGLTTGDLVLETVGLSVPLADIYATSRLAADHPRFYSRHRPESALKNPQAPAGS